MNETKEQSGVFIEGHIKIWDPRSNEVFVNKRNAINFENFSEALALSVAGRNHGFIHEMALGNGGTSIDSTGLITYLPTNTSNSYGGLYNQTYYKVINDTSGFNTDSQKNFIEVRHVPSTVYTDVMISCFLDYGEPSDQPAFDNNTNMEGQYVFDELGIRARPESGVPNTGKFLTHVVFHPVAKSLNRTIQIDYTIRIQTLTTLTSLT